MPVIRRIEASQGLGGAPTPSINVDDSIGQGLRSVAQGLGNVASTEMAIELRREQMAMQNAEFRTDQQFRRFQESLGTDLAEAQQNMDPSGAGLTEGFVTRFDEQSAAFLQTVPEALRPKFSELVETSRATWLDKVALDERDQRYSWFRTGIGETQEKLQGQVFNQPELFDAAKEDGLRAIDASGLPEAEKEELRKQWDEVLAVTLAEREIRDTEANPALAADAGARLGVPGATQNGGDALSLLREFEGFRETPYWDVNANRVGYGSDTVTDADGTVRRVTSNTRVSRADAERDLQRRAKEFEATAAGQVGAEAWQALPPNAQAALVSVAYNYGSLPRRVVNAVATGNVASIAGAVQALGSDNGGVNRKRRAKEAAIIRGDTELANNAPDMSDPRFASLSLSQRLELYDRTQAAAERGFAAIEAQKKAVNASTYDSLTLGVETGDVVSEQTILNNQAIDDGQKATLLKAFRAKREENAGVGELISAITSGGGARINSFDADQAKLGDKAYQRMIEAVPQENRQSVTRAFVQETGYIPKTEIASIRQGVEQASPADFASVLTTARNYQIAAPEHFENADGLSAARRDLELFTAYTDNMGYSAEEAARKVLDRRNPERQMNEEVLGAQADKILKDVTADEVAGYFSGGLRILGGTGTPSAGADTFTQSALMSDFNVAFRERFFETGDEDEAKALAANDLQKTWGVSEISGDRQLMKYPPEKFYPPVDGGFDYLRADAVQTATEFAGSEPTSTYLRPWIDPVSGRNLTAEDIRAGRSPRYRLIYEREENGQRVIDMAPGTWAMPADEISRLTTEAQEQQMQAAQEEREFQRRVVAPVAGEGIAAVQNALRSEQAPSVQRARQESQRAGQAGSAIGAMAAPVESVEVRDLAEPQGVDGVRSSVQQQGRELRNGGGGW